jgi:hypothetical protein
MKKIVYFLWSAEPISLETLVIVNVIVNSSGKIAFKEQAV